MKKIDFGELAVSSMKQEEIIAWLSDSLASTVYDLDEAIKSQNMGSVGEVMSGVVLMVSVTKALDKSINGKKEGTVL